MHFTSPLILTDLVSSEQTYDAVVGDITIVASRWYVDFTLPYSDSGVSMVVPVKRSKNLWIFIRPFSWDLWLTIMVASVITGLMLSFFEHRTYSNQSQRMGHRKQIDMVLWLPMSSLYFAQSKIKNIHVAPLFKFSSNRS